MNFFTVRNLVILALVQVAVVTAGVLAVGAYVRWINTFHLCGSIRELELICDFGWLALALPLIWAAVALWEFRQETEEDGRKTAIVFAGWLLLALLIYASWHYSVGPWLRLMTGCGGLSG